MTLREFRNVLLDIGVPVFHKKAQKASEYIVWQEVRGGLGFDGDGRSAECGKRISVEFYTKSEYSGIPEKIDDLFSGYDDICFDGPVIDFDEETDYTRYIFTVEVYGNG